MSEYLDRLKQLRDATPPPGKAPYVQDNVSFRKAIDYIEKLETRVIEADDLNTDQLITNAAQNGVIKNLRDKRKTDRINLINLINKISLWEIRHGVVIDTIAKYYGFKL